LPAGEGETKQGSGGKTRRENDETRRPRESGDRDQQTEDDPGSAAHHFVLRCARDDRSALFEN
jgi:hypothetical protein